MKPIPKTLLWRTFLLIAALMLLSVLAWFSIYRHYEREPRARQLSQLIVSVVNLTRTALVAARPEARRQLLAELSDREGIRIYPAEAHDRIEPLPERVFLHRVAALVRERLEGETRFTLEREGERALFVSFRIDDDEYWIALPRERIERRFPLQWLGWGVGALLLSLAGAWLVVFRVTRPLKALEKAATEIGRGGRPAPLPVEGPEEIATLAAAFNRMSADLARLDEDRALIMAGISHDLRTPLTRLRMEIEMTGADEAAREAMAADIEEMDRTIGQFLDFARTDGGEAKAPTDLASLIEELAVRYRRRGAAIETAIAPVPEIALPAQALRRAVGNLVDNALRHAGGPVEIALFPAGPDIVIEVRDRGPGIPPGEAERMKRPFTRLDAARTDALGAGLGLAIVERIVRSLGGRLDLSVREGGGLAARITFPA